MSEAVADKITEQFPLTHKGFGRYEVGGKTYPNKEEAESARARLVAEAEFQNEFGDVMPEGVDIKIIDRSLVFRGSLLEVPMNEVYLPEGDYNPYYSREWYYAWARRNRRSIASYEALGYRRVTYQELESMVDDGKAPAHYASLLQRDGDNLVHEDLLLMRTPRMEWRRRKAQEANESKRRREVRREDLVRDSTGAPLSREEIEL